MCCEEKTKEVFEERHDHLPHQKTFNKHTREKHRKNLK